MPQISSVRAALQEVSAALLSCDQPQLAEQVLRAAGSPEEQLIAFITSNDVWGGAGSIADQAGLEQGKRRAKTRKLEAALIHLGRAQIEAGKLNPRTVSWVSTFEQCEKVPDTFGRVSP